MKIHQSLTSLNKIVRMSVCVCAVCSVYVVQTNFLNYIFSMKHLLKNGFFSLVVSGFIKTRASTSPGSGGNLGIMDIIAALQWTKDNIAAFGGDPTRVTIVGHDTGAALANLVLISKSGKGMY